MPKDRHRICGVCRALLTGFVVAAAMAAAQGVPPEALASAQTAAEQTEKDWFAQARTLDAKLAPLLPCDAAARKTIQDVSHASETRITALMAYYRLVSTQAAEQTQSARKLLEAEEARAPEAADERTDASLERAAIEAQSTNLAASMKPRPELDGARSALAQLGDLSARTASLADQSATGRDRGVAAVRDLVSAYQSREAALKQQVDAFQSESTRWSTYYSVRLARAQAECAAIGGGSAPAPRSAVKGKAKKKQ
jgi:hypothetical protein